MVPRGMEIQITCHFPPEQNLMTLLSAGWFIYPVNCYNQSNNNLIMSLYIRLQTSDRGGKHSWQEVFFCAILLFTFN